MLVDTRPLQQTSSPISAHPQRHTLRLGSYPAALPIGITFIMAAACLALCLQAERQLQESLGVCERRPGDQAVSRILIPDYPVEKAYS